VWLSLALALVTGLITFLGGKLLINRAVDYMRQIAERMRELRTAQNPEPLVNAPDEIKAIHEALSALMASIHTEQERTRLLTAGLAHELGSPLQNLIGETEVALMSDKSPEEYRTVLESHLDELRDIGHAIGNLMTLVSIDESATPHDLERFDLAGEAEVRLRRERAHAQRRGIELDVAKDGDLGLVGDREALWLVVSNLVANAIDYTPRGGRVRHRRCRHRESAHR
jgi:two-component system heavy metal sensor histidine kinase CusS